MDITGIGSRLQANLQTNLQTRLQRGLAPQQIEGKQVQPISKADRVQQIRSINADLATIGSGIDRIASSARPGLGVPFGVTNVADAIARWSFNNVRLEPGATEDVNVTVTQSAQQGALFLARTDGTAVMEGGLQIQLEGSGGVETFTLASGTSLSQLAAAINQRQPLTGVQAHLNESGDAVEFRSTGYGADAFVSVAFTPQDQDRKPDAGLTLFGALPDDANTPADTPLASGAGVFGTGFLDQGQDVMGTVNGTPARGEGTLLHFETPSFTGALSLKAGALSGSQSANAQNLGSFLGLTLSSRPSGKDESPGIDLKG